MKAKKVYMAIDQYGHHYDGLTRPRAQLCDILCKKHVDMMYMDGKDGKRYHVGYVIGGLWLRLYEVSPYRKEA